MRARTNVMADVTAVGNGTATITAKAGTRVVSARVTVSQKTSKVSLTLNGQNAKGTLKAQVKKSYILKATVAPANADKKNAKISWKTSNSKIATVRNGKVTIKKKGTVTITATTKDGRSAKVKFKADKKPVKIASIKIRGNKTMKAKKSQKLIATVTPSTAVQTVTWKSSNKKIATVDKKGKVKAKKKGTVTITATSKDKKKTAKFKIKVK